MNMYHHLKIVWRRRCRSSLFLQTLLIMIFWLAGEFVARAAHLPIPGAIVGLFIVLALLGSKRLSVCSVQRGARLFIADMLLFFVPAVLAVLDHPELLGMVGLKILAVIVLGTLTVMVVTATVIDVCYSLNLTGKGPADAAE
ncbi:CidA/LrgA family protein [Geobacter sp. AOG2]|uniref:CidA/LrgA family protein n=1 Tax=Geobacter sp. AOG2 TaxID=1566347 RepID=UPI001CC38405|nr:CidA/LrgA family protein [Geobacter sp. AOG2]GFE61961.1 CidA/LrgA family protein [Geobacter sp. AOG2]